MTRFAPTWALTAAAIDATGDPQLRPGVHLRVLPSLALGLPVAPLLVERIDVGDVERPSDDVAWSDLDLNPLATPFELGDVGTAVAWLPNEPGNPVIYAEVLVTPKTPWRDPRLTAFERHRALIAGVRTPFHVSEHAIGIRPPFTRVPLPRAGVRVEAMVSGPLGTAAVATATAAPYRVCATGMDRVHVTGAGTVTGIRVLRVGDLKIDPGREPWRLLALPIERAARYEGLPSAEKRAWDRVERGAPLRVGMHDDPDAAAPAACAPATVADEVDRVDATWSNRVEEMVTAVVDDLSAPPPDLTLDSGPLNGPKVTTGSLELPALAGALQAGLDPGVGRLLGLVEHDDAPPAGAGALVVYLVRGAWLAHPQGVLRFLLGGPDDPDDFPLDLPGIAREGREGRYVDLWTVAAVVVGQPVAPVAPPGVGAGVDQGWVPDPPPSARRHAVLPLSGLVPAAAIALARETPGIVGLNTLLSDAIPGAPDRAIPIVPGMLAQVGPMPAAQHPGEGEVHDRWAPPFAAHYRVAQADWFGRWSEWAAGAIGPGLRPPLPVPVIDVAYVDPPSPGMPGRLDVRCQQPRAGDLAAGSRLLQELVVSADVGGPVATATAPAVAGAPMTPPVLTASVTVPALAPAQRRRLTATAHWVDAGGAASAESMPAVAWAFDPRSPAPLVVPNTLTYASRPDALGRSRMDISWPATAGHAYRVYTSDETTLRQRLADLVAAGAAGATAATAALAAATTAPDRAAVFRANAGLFDRTCFELVTPSPLLASSTAPMTYLHEVSGSLGALQFFKVLPVSVLATSPVLQLGAETPFASSVLMVRGVPNSPAPPTPTLTASVDPADPLAVRLTVGVPEGRTAPVRLRMRRSRVSGADAQTMPVVMTMTPGAWPATVTDRGAVPWDAAVELAPWTTYTWRVEVQGPSEPGSSVPGLWSEASAPASQKVMPGPPAPPAAGSAVASAGAITVTFTSPDPLAGGLDGDYTVTVYRRRTDGDMAGSGQVASASAGSLRQPDGSYVVVDTAPGVPVGTEYLAEVRDPVGRVSSRVVVATL